MRLFFVRHAKSLDRSSWLNDDLLRPLSDKGINGANIIFNSLAKIYEAPEYIITSKAQRALETAKIFQKYFASSVLVPTELLHPGAPSDVFVELINKYSSAKTIAFVGHEPDLGNVLLDFLGCDALDVEIKKGTIIEIEFEVGSKALLRALIPPKVLL